MSVIEELKKIQQELKVPKNQYNSFGGYYYRSCEDILDAVKPFIKDKLVLTLEDEMVQVGERNYVKATAKLTDGNEEIKNSAYARESEERKGMDLSQITGATSSYARKYALNGLFAIDDIKDADTMNNNSSSKKQKTSNEPQYVKTETPQAKSQPKDYKCQNCGAGIDKQVYDYSMKFHKKPLCRDCQTK